MNTLATSLLLACVGVLLAWLLRRPARRLVGAGPAFCLWLLPPLLAIVAWLPAWHATVPGIASMLVMPRLLVEPHVAAATGDAGFDFVHTLFVLWLAGCAIMLVRLALHGLHIMRRSRPLPEAMHTVLKPNLASFDPRAIRLHPAGPAVCWLPGCRLLLPADVLQRFSAEQLAQVMAHERMHLARRDPLWSLLAELMLSALWFFPPVWSAMTRFRLDQELACDAAIVNHAPRQAGAYARALLSGATTPRTLAATTPWLSQPQLKERLTMIQNHSRTLLTRRSGYAVLVTLLVGVALAAHAAMPSGPVPTMSSQSMTVGPDTPASTIHAYRRQHPPRYPMEALANKHEGTVVLLVQVDAAGKPVAVKIDKSSGYKSLDEAATKAAMQWKYNPGTRDGKPVSSSVRVPVAFQLKPVNENVAFHIQKTSEKSFEIQPLDSWQQPPRYPEKAYKNHHEGTVILLVHVNASGTPEKVKVKQSSGYSSLDEAAVVTVTRWKFYPKILDGKPVSSWSQVPITFQMNDKNTKKDAPHSSSSSS